MSDRRERLEARRRRAFAVGIAVSLALHVAALALVQFRIDPLAAGPDAPVRLLPRVHEPQPPEPVHPPEERLIEIRQAEAAVIAGAPERAEASEAAAAPEPVLEPVPGQAGATAAAAPSTDAGAPAVTGPAVLRFEPMGQRVARADGDPGRDPGGVPLYEPGSIWRVKSGWLAAAGLDPRGAAVSVWVVGCPAPRTIVSAAPTPTFRGRPCH